MGVIAIKGMSCQHCVASVTKALEEIPGISAVSVSLEDNQASFEGDPDKELVKEAITKIGFEVVS